MYAVSSWWWLLFWLRRSAAVRVTLILSTVSQTFNYSFVIQRYARKMNGRVFGMAILLGIFNR